MESPFFLASGVLPVTNALILRRVTFVPKHRFYKMPIDNRYSSHARTNEHHFRSLFFNVRFYFFFFFNIVDDSRVAIENSFLLSPINNHSQPRIYSRKKRKKNIFHLEFSNPRFFRSLSKSERNSFVLLYSYIHICIRDIIIPPRLKPFSISPPTHKSGPKGALCTHSAFRYARRKVVTSSASTLQP